MVMSLGLVYNGTIGEDSHIYGNEFHALPWIKWKDCVIPPYSYNREENLSKIAITSMGDGPYYGFTLEGPDHLYLLSDFTVTHNTTELLRRVMLESIAQRSVVYFNHASDIRSSGAYSTHNPLYREQLSTQSNVVMRSVSELPDGSELKDFDTVAVDEGQFFHEDLLKVISYAEDYGKKVIIAGLISDFNRKKFGCLLDIAPMAESFDMLTAICKECVRENPGHRGEPGIFSHNTQRGRVEGQVDVGGAEKYIAVCRRHYRRLNGLISPDDKPGEHSCEGDIV